eukprot:scaffold9598_cov105-Amphora_coffeaeformis.AAC.1
MGSSGTCMSRSRWSGPSDGSQAQREGGRSSRSPPWNSWGVESGSLEMCLARYLPMAVVPVMTKGPRTRCESLAARPADAELWTWTVARTRSPVEK